MCEEYNKRESLRISTGHETIRVEEKSVGAKIFKLWM
jgi:hypothetical protein